MKKLTTALGGLLLVLIIALLWPLPEQLLNPVDQSPLQIRDRKGKVLYEVRQQDFGTQAHLDYEEIPELAISTLIAIEDHRYYSHWGVDPIGVMRALWHNLQADKVVSGASTITMQLVRNRLQPERRNVAYKLREMFWALKLETQLSKEDILEAYFNSAYFGQQAYGLQAASRTFFGKSPGELSTAEMAFLIGLLQSPTGYDPYQRFELAKQRQAVVLKAMRASDTITTPIFEEALEEPLRLAKPKVDIRAPHFVFWVLEQLGEVSSRQIDTTLDLDLQTEIERIIDNELAKLEDKNVSSAAVVVMDVDTGEVLSMVGSADYFDDEHDGQVNVAVSSRQPGSALKPFTYALALAQGDTAASTVADIEAQFFTQEGNPYIPRNYDYGYHGLVRYREALANSYNIPAVKLAEKVGVPRLLEFLRKAGLSTLTDSPDFYGVALTLGSGEVRLLELVQAFGIFPRGGRTLTPQFLLGEEPESSQQILGEQIAWLISDILSDNQARIPEFGEDSPLAFDFPVAAKTGTTRNSRDNWTVGYTPDYLVGVWVGNADNSPMIDTSGITGAGPIFKEVVSAVTKNEPPRAFKRPTGFVQRTVCKLSGLLPTPYCPHTIQEWFIAGTEPQQEDHLYQPVGLDTRTGLLASANCDPQFVEEQVFIDFPPELEKWARENGHAEKPREYSPLCPPSATDAPSSPKIPELVITRPNVGDSFQLDPLIPDEDERIVFEARAEKDFGSLTWLVDGEPVGEGKAPDFRFRWQPQLGQHEISLQLPNTPSLWIEVVEP